MSQRVMGEQRCLSSVLVFHPYQQVCPISVRQGISKEKWKGGKGGLLCKIDSPLIKINCLVKRSKFWQRGFSV